MKRILLAVSFAALAAPAFAAEVSAPYEQTQLDRGVQKQDKQEQTGRASAGATNADANVWANDWNFIAPAQ